ncbi:hypothetical protein GWI33_017395 [Rhynchophorus ferrugineus]|uniref:Uncharacterized protein n=1 Tax=Rhynchophorus ferrugineus TaxID=354439 RepID=A0A834IRA8_RHYFE|nr:hypothetical protein GWI33_017395 [Rhynchophorus ferrugineus]
MALSGINPESDLSSNRLSPESPPLLAPAIKIQTTSPSIGGVHFRAVIPLPSSTLYAFSRVPIAGRVPGTSSTWWLPLVIKKSIFSSSRSSFPRRWVNGNASGRGDKRVVQARRRVPFLSDRYHRLSAGDECV